MADVVVDAPPFNPVKPLVSVGAVGNAVEFACAAGELAVEVDQDETETETFCGTFVAFKAEKWTITATAYPSYGDNGLWNALRPLVGAVHPFVVLPDAAAAVGPENPEMSGEARVKAFSFYAGTPGEPTTIDVVLAVQGEPAFDTVGGVLLEADDQLAE